VDSANNFIYVVNAGTANVTAINGATNQVVDLGDPKAGTPLAIAVNPVTHLVFVGNDTSNNVTVIGR
jgi:DNA-binding beta-propeller fold protein YncE